MSVRVSLTGIIDLQDEEVFSCIFICVQLRLNLTSLSTLIAI